MFLESFSKFEYIRNIKDLNQIKNFLKVQCSNISFMQNKKHKKLKSNSNNKNQDLGETKNSAKLVLFIFGIGPIIGITVFLYSKGFFNSPNM